MPKLSIISLTIRVVKIFFLFFLLQERLGEGPGQEDDRHVGSDTQPTGQKELVQSGQ